MPKSITLAALGQVGGEALAGRYAKAKKAELAQACERIFAGDFIAEVEVKEAALAWLPDAMRFGAVETEGEEVAIPAVEGTEATEITEADEAASVAVAGPPIEEAA